ncbi:aspartate kinase [Franzmannia pantelleriensis]|uniref:Aspartokinase n=1 Tax=Franzmannia pantelleriensis TaxID=48727 RepID=A0A1G9TC14_9GAMM|nr:aspartate kinase [Halomonas pantelleriensis]SDM45154.1 aspartate kinase [Halomonas pantelleriensis]
MTTIFKFGGASIKDAEAIRHLGELLNRLETRPRTIVISAMGKTTNALEALLAAARHGDESDYRHQLEALRRDHLATVESLFGASGGSVAERVETLLEELDECHRQHRGDDRPHHYDQTICYGELLSTTIVSAWLNEIGVDNDWYDARQLIVTDANHQAANVDWAKTSQRLKTLEGEPLVVTQGFIGGTADGDSTTLGREGSDFSAAIIAHCLGASEVVIWKDVPGLFNADPRRFDNARQLMQISYHEAIELAWLGAKVIHPKTLAPLRERQIPLKVRSFKALDAPHSVISARGDDDAMPACILAEEQVLLEIQPRDFSFMDEARQLDALGRLVDAGLHANLIDSSAMRLSLCLDAHPERLEPLVESLDADYALTRHDDLTLLSVRHPTQALLDSLSKGRAHLVERRNREVAQRLFHSNDCPETWHIPD